MSIPTPNDIFWYIARKQEQNIKSFQNEIKDTDLISTRNQLQYIFNWFGTNLALCNNYELILRENRVQTYPDDKVRVDQLFMSFIYGEENTFNQIASGNYIQAANLVRQELEILASIRQDEKNAKINKSPNAALTNELNQLYGSLSEAAHARNEKIRHNTSGDNHEKITPTGVAYEPSLDVDMSIALLGLHLLIFNQLLLEFIKNAQSLYAENIKDKSLIEKLKAFEKILSDDYTKELRKIDNLKGSISNNKTAFEKLYEIALKIAEEMKSKS